MICAIMQPTYIPWCGYFDLIDRVDKFVFLDNVKLEKSDWHVRNRIKSASGETMLSIDVTLPNGRMNTMINQAKLNLKVPWQKKHLKSVYANYRKSKYFDHVYPFLEVLINTHHENLSDFTISIIEAISIKVGIKTQFIRSSNIDNVEGIKDERLVSICNNLDVKNYLSPVGSAVYLNKNTPGGELVKHNINLFYHQFEHPIHEQLFGEFKSHLSIIDMLFNYGFDNTLNLIRSGRKTKLPYSELGA